MWKLNQENFKPGYGMNFQRFFNMQMVLLRETPLYFKLAMNKVKRQELNKL
jgi:hypothetical protein